MLERLPILDLSELDAGAERATAFRDRLRRVTHEVGCPPGCRGAIHQDLL
jgi:hypothetical protein